MSLSQHELEQDSRSEAYALSESGRLWSDGRNERKRRVDLNAIITLRMTHCLCLPSYMQTCSLSEEQQLITDHYANIHHPSCICLSMSQTIGICNVHGRSVFHPILRVNSGFSLDTN